MTKLKLLLFIFLTLNISSSFAQKKKKKNNLKTEATSPISENDRFRAERFFFEGHKEMAIGKIFEAYEFFNYAVMLNPEFDVAHYLIAKTQLKAGAFEEAVSRLETAIKLSPNNIYYLQLYADALFIVKDFAKAAKVYKKLRSLAPNNFEYYKTESRYLTYIEDYTGALSTLDAAEKHFGLEKEIIMQKHWIYANNLNKKAEALNEINKGIKEFPNDLDYKIALGQFYIHNSNNDTDKGIDILDEVLSIDSSNIMTLSELYLHYKKKEEYSKAFYYEKALFKNPSFNVDGKVKLIFDKLTVFDDSQEMTDEISFLIDLLIKDNPKEAKAFAIAGDFKNITNKDEEALEYYMKSLDFQKDIFSVWQQVFFINSSLKNFDELIEITNQAKEYFPNQSLVYYFNGFAHYQNKDIEKAEKSYSRALKIGSENLLLKGEIYANLGEIYNELKRYKESDENYEKALEINPKNAYVLNNYSYYLSLREEHLDKAEKMSLLSNELIPNNVNFLDTYAWVLYKKGKYKEALEWQKKALDATDDPSGVLLEHLGDILYELNKKDEALEYWKKAAEKEEGSRFLNQKIAEKKLYE